jgi:hypothetical protein
MAYRFPSHSVDPTRHGQEFIAWHKKAKPGASRAEDGVLWTKHEDGSLSVGREKSAMVAAFFDELEKIANPMAARAAEAPSQIGNMMATAGGQPRIWDHPTLGAATRYARGTIPAGRPRVEFMSSLAERAPHLFKPGNFTRMMGTIPSKLRN